MYLLMTEEGKNAYEDVAISSKRASVQNPGSPVPTTQLKSRLESNYANWNLLLRSPKNSSSASGLPQRAQSKPRDSTILNH